MTVAKTLLSSLPTAEIALFSALFSTYVQVSVRSVRTEESRKESNISGGEGGK